MIGSKKLEKKKKSIIFHLSEPEKSEEDFSIKKSNLEQVVTEVNSETIILKDSSTFILTALSLSGGKHFSLQDIMYGRLIWQFGYSKWHLLVNLD